MSSYFDDASLVMIPSGYKTSKVYSVKPTDGSGDLTFSRSNDTATRVNSAGLIEKVRTNLALYSEEFNQPQYTKVNSTITANAGVAPDGTTTADKLIMNNGQSPTSADNSGWRQNTAITSGIYAFSFYAKAAEFSSVNIRENFNTGAFLNINLTNGVVTNPAPSEFIDATATNVGNGWYRIAWGAPSGTNNIQKYNIRAGVTGDGTSGFLNWGFQVEAGDIATDYIQTTTAAVSVGPVANVPRLDYLNSTCPRLLLEPQRTNSALFSEQFNNAAYSNLTVGSATAPIITANFAASPDGFQNADRLQFSRTGTTSSDLSLLQQSAIVLSATGTATIYLKSNTSSTQNVLLYWGGGQGIVFAVTPEWQRFTLPNLAAGTDTILIGTRGGSGSFYNGGDLTLDVLAYGLQIEAGAYATSYIPTLGAAVTRGADDASKTGISSLIGQSEGTLFVEVKATFNTRNGRFILSQGNNVNFIELLGMPNGKVRGFAFNGSQQADLVSASTYSTGDTLKIALAYKANDFVLYINGTQQGTAASGVIPASMNTILLNNYNVSGFDEANAYKQALLFKTRLTNAQLAELTTI